MISLPIPPQDDALPDAPVPPLDGTVNDEIDFSAVASASRLDAAGFRDEGPTSPGPGLVLLSVESDIFTRSSLIALLEHGQPAVFGAERRDGLLRKLRDARA